MSSTVQEHEMALTQHYEKNLQDIKQELERMYFQMQAKDKTIAQNQEIINKLDYQLDNYRKEIFAFKEK